MSRYKRLKRLIETTKTVEKIREIEQVLIHLYEDYKLTERELSRLDLLCCDQWVKIDTERF